DDPRLRLELARRDDECRHVDLEIGQSAAAERELADPDGIDGEAVIDSPIGKELDERAGPIEERLGWFLAPDPVDEDDTHLVRVTRGGLDGPGASSRRCLDWPGERRRLELFRGDRHSWRINSSMPPS